MNPTPLSVSRAGAAGFLLAAQSLDRPVRPAAKAGAPAAVLREIRRLECVQLDPVAAVERNQHLVLGARIPGYAPAALESLLRRRRVFEYWANAACVIPIEDYPLLEGTRRRFSERLKPHLEPLRAVADDIVAALEKEGPLPSRAFASDHRVHGYWDNQVAKTKATSHALNLLLDAGEIVTAAREGTTRYFDLPEHAIPAELRDAAARISPDEADELLLEKYLRAYRIFDAGDGRFGWRRMGAEKRRAAIERRVSAGIVVPLEIEGVRRRYFVRAEDVEALQRHDRGARRRRRAADGAIRFLPPLDNLLWRRERIADLFGFEYTWEVYIPAAKRRYGYYTMPILAGRRLIGRLDPRLDRERGRLRVELLALEPGVEPTAALADRLRSALDDFARFHGAEEVALSPSAREALAGRG